MKTTIRIEVEMKHEIFDEFSRIKEAARSAFPEATSITVESEDGTSETVYTRKP